jgi:hypothetical protein
MPTPRNRGVKISFSWGIASFKALAPDHFVVVHRMPMDLSGDICRRSNPRNGTSLLDQ